MRGIIWITFSSHLFSNLQEFDRTKVRDPIDLNRCRSAHGWTLLGQWMVNRRREIKTSRWVKWPHPQYLCTAFYVLLLLLQRFRGGPPSTTLQIFSREEVVILLLLHLLLLLLHNRIVSYPMAQNEFMLVHLFRNFIINLVNTNDIRWSARNR